MTLDKVEGPAYLVGIEVEMMKAYMSDQKLRGFMASRIVPYDRANHAMQEARMILDQTEANDFCPAMKTWGGVGRLALVESLAAFVAEEPQ